MGLFLPQFYFERAIQITPEFLQRRGIRALLLDVDNTLARHGEPEPFPGVRQWLAELKSAGIALIILSNAKSARVSSTAKWLRLDFIPLSMKPLPFGYIRAKKRLKLKSREIAIVGDQLFTDIIGGKICGIRTILVNPVHRESGITFKIKRRIEKRLLKNFRRDNSI